MASTKEVKFVIRNIPPQPRNKSHTIRKVNRGGKDVPFLGKTEMAVMFEKDLVQRLLQLNKVDFAGFDYFEYCLVVGTPSREFWTEKKEVSKTSIDFDAHKVFTDVVAKECYFNDGQIVFHSYMKVPVDSPYWYFAVSIKAGRARDFMRDYGKEEFIQLLAEKGYQVL
jgi:hypothetical protein